MKSSLTEYKEMLDTIVSSDDASIKEYYGVANKEMDQAADSRKQFYAFVKQVQADCSKLLDNPNLPPEMMIEMSEIFGVDKSGISRHLKKIFETGKLDEKVVVAKIATTTRHGAIEGKRTLDYS